MLRLLLCDRERLVVRFLRLRAVRAQVPRRVRRRLGLHGLLPFVHRLIGPLEQVVERVVQRRIPRGVAQRGGDALPRRQRLVRLTGADAPVQRVDQPVALSVVLVFEHHGELVAAETEHGGVLEDRADQAAKLLNGQVALVVAVVVVELLEVVQIDHREAERRLAGLDFLLQSVAHEVEGPLVAHLGQSVDVREIAHLVGPFTGDAQLLRHIEEAVDVALDVLLHLRHRACQRLDLVAGVDVEIGEQGAAIAALRAVEADGRVGQGVDRTHDEPVDEHDAAEADNHRQKQQRQRGDREIQMLHMHHLVHGDVNAGVADNLSGEVVDRRAGGDEPAVFSGIGEVRGEPDLRVVQNLRARVQRVDAARRADVLVSGVHEVNDILKLRVDPVEVDAIHVVHVLYKPQIVPERHEVLGLLHLPEQGEVVVELVRAPFGARNLVLRAVVDGEDLVTQTGDALRVHGDGDGAAQGRGVVRILRPDDVADDLAAGQDGHDADEQDDRDDQHRRFLSEGESHGVNLLWIWKLTIW